MKIIVTTHSYWPMKDGVSMVNQYLFEGLVKLGHEIILVTNLLDGNKVEEKHNGVNIIRIPFKVTRFHKYIGDKKKFQDTLLKLTKDADWLFNICTQTPFTDWSMELLKNIKCKKLLYMHGMWTFGHNDIEKKTLRKYVGKTIDDIYFKKYYRRIKKYVYCYDKVVQLHEKDPSYKFFSDKYNIKCDVIENACEDRLFINKKNIKEKYILNVSNYCDIKNQLLGLKLFLNNPNIDKDYKLIFIGSGKNEYYDMLINYYKNNNKYNRKVEFYYGVDRDKTVEFIKGASLTFITSIWEAFPITIVESCASHTPFISRDVGIVKYINGGVICYNDDDFNYYLDLFTNNENIRVSYGELAYQEALSKFTIKNKVDLLNELISN